MDIKTSAGRSCSRLFQLHLFYLLILLRAVSLSAKARVIAR
jgi:hypothetical protein